jgi:uncharacterized damage-inducible protein DinB
MNKAQLLGAMRNARWRWELALARVREDQFTEPTMHGGWSVKDSIGHVAYYERWLLNWLEDAVRGKVTLATHRDLLNVDERNALIYVENKDRRLQAIQDDARLVFERLYQLVQTLPEQELIDAYHFDRYIVPLWGKSLPLWECIAGDSYEHYVEHTSNIRNWLEAMKVEFVPA